MTDQKVVHVRRDSYDLYIGRGSDWGNPYKIGREGGRREVLAKYKDYLLRGEGRHLLERIGELEGLTLGCFCAPNGGLTAADETRCHGPTAVGPCESQESADPAEAGRSVVEARLRIYWKLPRDHSRCTRTKTPTQRPTIVPEPVAHCQREVQGNSSLRRCVGVEA